MATPVGFDPGTWNNATAAPFTLGAHYDYQGKTYRYFRNANGASDNAVADGDVSVFTATAVSGTTLNPNVVSNNLAGTGTGAPGNPPAGVGVGAVTKNYYGFFQTQGLHTNVKSTSSTAGVKQKVSATAATCTDQTAATISDIGTAETATSGGRCSVELRL